MTLTQKTDDLLMNVKRRKGVVFHRLYQPGLLGRADALLMGTFMNMPPLMNFFIFSRNIDRIILRFSAEKHKHRSENCSLATISPPSSPLHLDAASSSTCKSSTTSIPPLHHLEDEGGRCGWLSFRPEFLQKLCTSKWLLFGLVCVAATQGMVINGFVNVCISTIERRYNLQSASTGIIAGFYDIGVVICSIPVSYLGSLPGASKPRWLGWGILIMGIGSFVFVLPHFLSPIYGTNFSDGIDSTSFAIICLAEITPTSKCKTASEEWLSNYQYIFILGQLLHGVGASPLYTLGIAYLDESVPMEKSSLYLGMFHAMAVIGPAIGYVLGGQLLKVYIDSPWVDPKLYGITKTSDQWLGAWWIGFVIAGSLAISISWILMAFPAELAGAKKRALERTKAAGYIDADAFIHLNHLPAATMVLLRNLPFVFLSLAEASDALLIAGFAAFMPKIIENQFETSASFASLLVGVVAVPAGGGGTLVGGWIVKLWKLKCEDILKFCFILSSISFCLTFSFFMSCPERSLAGINVAYDNGSFSSDLPSFSSPCNEACNCQGINYDPVCGVNRVLYYSPCHAGCRTTLNLGHQQAYGDCQCISSSPVGNGSKPLELKSGGKSLPMPSSSAIRQKCPSKCSYLVPFLLLLFIVMMLSFLTSMPSMTGTLRCVPDTHRSLALGLQGIQIRLLGTIPGPVIFGIAMDNACTFWQNTCKGMGSCRQYNNRSMSWLLGSVSIMAKALCAISYFFSWRFYRMKKIQGTIVTRATNPSSNGVVLHDEDTI